MRSLDLTFRPFTNWRPLSFAQNESHQKDPGFETASKRLVGCKLITSKESIRTAPDGNIDLQATFRIEAQRVAAIVDLTERENEIFHTLESTTQIFADAQEVARGLLAIDRELNALHRDVKSRQDPRAN